LDIFEIITNTSEPTTELGVESFWFFSVIKWILKI
jgi:hypothetical protein